MNNFYHQFPAWMQDGSGISETEWQNRQENVDVMPIPATKCNAPSASKTNWDYRKYMQKNGEEIIKYNLSEAIHDSGNNPYIYSVVESQKPDSDLKQNYKLKEEQRKRMVSVNIPMN